MLSFLLCTDVSSDLSGKVIQCIISCNYCPSISLKQLELLLSSFTFLSQKAAYQNCLSKFNVYFLVSPSGFTVRDAHTNQPCALIVQPAQLPGSTPTHAHWWYLYTCLNCDSASDCPDKPCYGMLIISPSHCTLLSFIWIIMDIIKTMHCNSLSRKNAKQQRLEAIYIILLYSMVNNFYT